MRVRSLERWLELLIHVVEDVFSMWLRMLFPGGFVGRRGTHFNSILDATDRSWDSSSVPQIQFD